MKLETYTCDICGQQKGEVNRWWMQDKRSALFVFLKWNDDPEDYYHICSESCAAKALSKWMAGQ